MMNPQEINPLHTINQSPAGGEELLYAIQAGVSNTKAPKVRAEEKPYATPLEIERNELGGIELLVHLAKSGQIDPWNIDIVKVADEYLKAVSELKETDLKVTGKTLLFLAVLLRMKSDQLAGINYLNPPEDEAIADHELDPDFLEGAIQPKLRFNSLEEVIQRRTSTRQPRIRTVTLSDLIRELKKYEALERERSLREKVEKVERRRAGMMDYEDFTADDIEDMAHEEFIEETIFSLQQFLTEIFFNTKAVSLTQLTQQGGIDKISAFLALLFLSARGEIDLTQDNFYDEVYIVPASPPVEQNETLPA